MGAGEPATPVTVTASFSVPDLPNVTEPLVVEAVVVVVVVAGRIVTHSVGFPPSPKALSLEPV